MEMSRMKLKLQDTLASKTLADDMNASLRVRCVLHMCVFCSMDAVSMSGISCQGQRNFVWPCRSV